MPPHYEFDTCQQGTTCKKCDIGYILKNYVKPLMQTLTVDIRNYYMRLLTTKCLNTAVMLSVFMLGKKRGIAIANYCDTEKTRARHQSLEDDNNTILSHLKSDVLKRNPKLTQRYLYYILLTDGKFPFDDQTKTPAFFPGHVFIIEKMPIDVEQDQHVYYLYQSYINQYDLKEHIKRNNNTLKISYERLKIVLDGLDYILNVSKWDDKCVQYWKVLTFVDSSYLNGSNCKDNFFLCIKKAKVVDCLKHIQAYTSEKLNEIGPKVKRQSREVYGDRKLYDKTQRPLTVGKMYTKLKQLYEDVTAKKSQLSGRKNLQTTKNI